MKYFPRIKTVLNISNLPTIFTVSFKETEEETNLGRNVI